jgi:hypothetical protein
MSTERILPVIPINAPVRTRPEPGSFPKPEGSNKDLYLLLIGFIIAGIVLFFIWINPKKSIVENAKHVYNSSIEKMNTTYGKSKHDAEKSAQKAKDTWTSNLQNIYKIVISSILIFLCGLFNYFNPWSSSRNSFIITIITNILFVSAILFEYFSPLLDNEIIKLLHSIDAQQYVTTTNIVYISIIAFWVLSQLIYSYYKSSYHVSESTNFYVVLIITILSILGILFEYYFDNDKTKDKANQDIKDTKDSVSKKEKKITEYKIFVLSFIFILCIIANSIYRFTQLAYYTPDTNVVPLTITQLGINVLFLGLLLFELLSDKIDKVLYQNTIDNNIHHKTLVSIITGIVCFLSFGYYFFEKNKTNQFILVITTIISFLLTIFTLFNVPGYDSNYYIFMLFFILNIPVVYLFIDKLIPNTDKSKMYIPLFITFYTACMFILAIMGVIDISNTTNIYLTVGLLGLALISYSMQQISDPKYKIFLSLIALIALSIVSLHYIVTSNLWYVYVLLFIGVLYYFKIITIPLTVTNTVEDIKISPPKLTSREKMVLGGEVIFVLLFLYIRSIIQKAYTINGQLLVNNPISLNNNTSMKVNKKFKYTYGLSCWLNIQPMTPGSSPEANEYVNILSYGNTPKITYCSALNIMRVEIQNESKTQIITNIKNIPLQKWNHIVVNYTDGICDVFLNGELYHSKKNVVPYNTSSTVDLGLQNGINGEICNLTIFHEQFTLEKIQQLYLQFKDKTPPIF